MNEKIVNTLEDIAQYIHMLRNIGSFYEDDAVKYYRNLVDSLEESERFHLLPKDVLQACFRVLQDVRDGYMDFNDGFLRLANIIDSQTDEYKSAYKKLTNSLDMDGNLVELVDKTNDSKSYLNTINDLMQNYQNVYNRFGEMESVDALCAVGNAIKEGVEQNKISKKSAEELLTPLQEIREDFFNENVQEEQVKKFYALLQDKLSKEDEQEKNQSKDNKEKAENGIVGTVINDGVTLGKNIGNAATNIVKGLREANKKIDENAQKKAVEYEMKAQDVVQNPNETRKIEKEQQQQDQNADKKGLKQPQQVQKKDGDEKLTSEQAIQNINSSLKEYKDVYTRVGSIIDLDHPEVLENWKKLVQSVNYAVDNNLFSEDVANEMTDVLRDMRAHCLRQDIQMEGIKDLGSIVEKQLLEYQKDSKQDTQEKGVVQNSNETRKIQEEQFQQDKKLDKQDLKQQQLQEKLQNHQEFTKRIQDFMDSYKTKLEDGNIGEARYEIDKLSRDIAKSARDGDIPQGLASQYRKMLVEQFQSSPENIENNKDKFMTGLTDLWEKYEGKHIEQEHDMQARDVVQKPNETRKIQEEQFQQDKKDSFERTNKLKDGIINVLNKHEEKMRDKQREKEQQQQQNKEVQEKLLIKKLFGKGNTAE